MLDARIEIHNPVNEIEQIHAGEPVRELLLRPKMLFHVQDNP